MKCLLYITLFFLVVSTGYGQRIRVGAKHFNEGYILSEIISQLLEHEGYTVTRSYNLGGTLVCFEALKNNAIDIYPEYSGTIAAEILKQPQLTFSETNLFLFNNFKLETAEPYGFNNTYTLVIKKEISAALTITAISDLRKNPELKIGVSYEFLKRQDGWENLSKRYALPHLPTGLEHGLAYEALNQNKIDVTDAYSTDGEISKYGLIALKDDMGFFPKYEATSLFRSELGTHARNVLTKLNGKIDQVKMQSMNKAVLYEKKSFKQVANNFLVNEGIIVANELKEPSILSDVLSKIATHLLLTFSALLLAICFAFPIGVWLYWQPLISTPILYVAGLLQTIPSIALLAILIPFVGIGMLPAIITLFLYALLPILRNTVSGLQSVDPLLKNVAEGIGMSRFQKLKFVEFPLAMPMILSGIRIAAVINVGTATLAAFIGAGGLGEYIVTGLALNSSELILRGAIPAALLALVVEIIFNLLEKYWIPKHIRN